jgi:hypothetical protein
LSIAVVHATPQPPQFIASLAVSTHAPPHGVVAAVQLVEHTPALHTIPAPQPWPHDPQFIGSVSVFTHEPLQ